MISLGPLAGAFAGRAARQVVDRVINGNGTEAELRKAEIDLQVIDAQAAIGQQSARPFLQMLAGVVIATYLMITVVGIIYNSFMTGSPFEWILMYTEGYLLLGWAITYTTSIGGLRALEKSRGEATNDSVADRFGGAVRSITGGGRSRKPNKPTIKTRTDAISRIDQDPYEFKNDSVDIDFDYEVDSIDFDVLKAEIRKEESTELKIYPDSEGFLTFGVGHKILPTDPEAGKPIGTAVSSERVESVFLIDVDLAYNAAREIVIGFDDLPLDARMVLINMAFQMGGEGLSKFKNMLAAIQELDWITAADEALDSKWAKQTPKRANKMADRLRALTVFT